MTKLIAIVPRWDFHRANRIFEQPEICTTHEAYRLWKLAAAGEGFILDTDDIRPPQSADVVWFIDLPRKKKLFDDAIASLGRSTKVILQVMESPLVSPYAHNHRNQDNFDVVLSYEKSGSRNPKIRHYKIPNTLVPVASDPPFSERRCVVMVNSNRMEGWFASSRVGTSQFQGFGKYAAGWKMSAMQFLHPARGELYSWRRRFARAAERHGRLVLDVYGSGWRGERIFWLPWTKPKPYRCAVEAPAGENDRLKNYHAKHELMANYRFGIAVENYRGNKGYISEKMIDVMRAGAVPVYWGEESIGEEFPQGSFVDVRAFRSCSGLLNYLVNCPEGEWLEMRARAREFLSSSSSFTFSNEAFVKVAMEILRGI